MSGRDADVVVVGGGPAGAYTAWALARAGADVVVLDRARFPRDKPCSEYLSPEASRLLADMGVLWIFLVGGPGETPATLEETLRFAAWRLGRGDAVYLTVGLRIYPGTTLQRIAVAEGVVAAHDPLLVPTFYWAPTLDLDRTVARLRAFAAAHPRFMFSADSRSPILPYLTRLASLLRLPRPHWRYMGIFRRLARVLS